MIGVWVFLAVASWKVLDVLGWLGGREARRVERWVGLVFALAIFVPIYLFNDSAPLMAVAQEMAKPITEMVERYIEDISTR